ncbi:hypothetical protein [Humidisolicoccus flavus]|uniref:hypothetical protein n=1 Tax=Humidisolicoccus flavus TaxID=3111414 RepID=UPI0032478C98
MPAVDSSIHLPLVDITVRLRPRAVRWIAAGLAGGSALNAVLIALNTTLPDHAATSAIFWGIAGFTIVVPLLVALIGPVRLNVAAVISFAIAGALTGTLASPPYASGFLSLLGWALVLAFGLAMLYTLGVVGSVRDHRSSQRRS